LKRKVPNKNKEKMDFFQELSRIIYWRDGIPYYRYDRGFKIKAGDEAGTVYEGYRKIKITIDGVRKSVPCGHLRWYMEYGVLPDNEIQHMDHNPDNNRIENLRDWTRSQNCRNRRPKGKYTGAYKHKKNWISVVRLNGESVYIGMFPSEEDAAMAYDYYIHKNNLRGYANINFPDKLPYMPKKVTDDNTSRYTGVAWQASDKAWSSQLMYKGERYYVGYFKDEMDAVRARDMKLIELGASENRLNLPKECYGSTK